MKSGKRKAQRYPADNPDGFMTEIFIGIFPVN